MRQEYCNWEFVSAPCLEGELHPRLLQELLEAGELGLQGGLLARHLRQAVLAAGQLRLRSRQLRGEQLLTLLVARFQLRKLYRNITIFVSTLQRYYSKNSKQIFAEKEVRGRNVQIYVSVSDLQYIFTRSIRLCLFCFRKYV